MSGVNHVAGGVVFTGIYLSMSNINIFSSALFLFFTAFFSLLPDIDHTSSILGKPFYPISRYLDRKFGHRTITHSLVVYIALIIVVKMFELIITGGNTITHIFIWAYASHLILDMLTVKGIPLFYPFKKNPCVIPGNPKYRFRSVDFKAEAMVFGIFIMLMFSLQDLFANGFWNTYNRSWNSVKALYTERLLYSNVIRVKYDFYQESKHYEGTGILINASLSDAIIFDNHFYNIQKEDRIVNLTPIRSKENMIFKEVYFTNLSFDSLQHLLINKPVISLKMQTSLPLNFMQNNKPQSSTSVEMDYVFNPVFSSQNVDSTDKQTEKELFDALQELSTKQELYNAKLQVIQLKKEENQTIQAEYKKALDDLNSSDLSAREMAMKSIQKLKTSYENSLNNIPVFPENFTALNNKIAFLKSKIHIVKTQSINGYLKYIQIN